MTNSEMKKVAIHAAVFSVVAMGLMFHRAATKHIMIADASGIEQGRINSDLSYDLLVNDSLPKGKKDTLVIPLSKDVSSDDIVLEDLPSQHGLRIYIDSREEDFYRDNAIATDLDMIERAVCYQESESGSVCLDFTLDGLYVNESSLTDVNSIEVRFFRPTDRYDRIVLADPGTDPSEKDIALDTALLLKQCADRDEASGIKIFLTRLSDEEPSADKKKEMLKETGAQLYLEITAKASDDKVENGIASYYNSRYYLRDYTNAEFAASLEKDAALGCGGRAIGVFAAKDIDENDILAISEIPSARVNLGYVTGEGDSGNLTRREYRKKLSEGLYQGILKAFEEME